MRLFVLLATLAAAAAPLPAKSAPDEVPLPPMPDRVVLDALAEGLVAAFESRYGEQRNAARKLVERFSLPLAPSLRTCLETGRIKDDGVRERIEALLGAVRPD